jgi:multidrug efflux system membrane fusion protein
VVADGLTAGERLVTSGFARLADKALVEVTATEEVGQPPAIPTIDTQSRGKGRGKGGAEKGGADKGGGKGGGGKSAADKGGEKGKTQGAGTGAQGTTGAKPSATP